LPLVSGKLKQIFFRTIEIKKSFSEQILVKLITNS